MAGIIRATVGGTDITQYLESFTATGSGPGSVGAATLILNKLAGGLTLQNMADVKIWMSYASDGSGVASRGRLFGGLVAIPSYRNQGQTIQYSVQCQDWNVLGKALVSTVAVNLVLAAGTMQSQIQQVLDRIQKNGYSSVATPIGIADFTSSNTVLPSVTYDGGHNLAYYIDKILVAQMAATPLLALAYWIGPNKTYSGATATFGGPVLNIYDQRDIGTIDWYLVDVITGAGQQLIYGPADMRLDGSRLIQKREGVFSPAAGQTRVMQYTDTASGGLYPNPYINDGLAGNQGYWREEPLNAMTETDATAASAQLQRVVAGGSNPRQTVKMEIDAIIQPGDLCDVVYGPFSLNHAKLRVAQVDYGWEDPARVWSRLQLGSKQIGLLDDQGNLVDGPVQMDNVAIPAPPTALAYTTAFSYTLRGAVTTVTATASTSTNIYQYNGWYRVAGGAWTKLPGAPGSAPSMTFQSDAAVAFDAYFEAVNGRNQVSDKSATLSGTTAARPSVPNTTAIQWSSTYLIAEDVTEITATWDAVSGISDFLVDISTDGSNWALSNPVTKGQRKVIFKAAPGNTVGLSVHSVAPDGVVNAAGYTGFYAIAARAIPVPAVTWNTLNGPVRQSWLDLKTGKGGLIIAWNSIQAAYPNLVRYRIDYYPQNRPDLKQTIFIPPDRSDYTITDLPIDIPYEYKIWGIGPKETLGSNSASYLYVVSSPGTDWQILADGRISGYHRLSAGNPYGLYADTADYALSLDSATSYRGQKSLRINFSANAQNFNWESEKYPIQAGREYYFWIAGKSAPDNPGIGSTGYYVYVFASNDTIISAPVQQGQNLSNSQPNWMEIETVFIAPANAAYARVIVAANPYRNPSGGGATAANMLLSPPTLRESISGPMVASAFSALTAATFTSPRGNASSVVAVAAPGQTAPILTAANLSVTGSEVGTGTQRVSTGSPIYLKSGTDNTAYLQYNAGGDGPRLVGTGGGDLLSGTTRIAGWNLSDGLQVLSDKGATWYQGGTRRARQTAGPSFPAAPVTGDMHEHTVLRRRAWFDGTWWVSEQYALPLTLRDFTTQPYAPPFNRTILSAPVPSSLVVQRFTTNSYTLVAQNSANYWEAQLLGETAAAATSIFAQNNLSAGATANSWSFRSTLAPNFFGGVVLGRGVDVATYVNLHVVLIATNSPGLIYLTAGLWVRDILA